MVLGIVPAQHIGDRVSNFIDVFVKRRGFVDVSFRAYECDPVPISGGIRGCQNTHGDTDKIRPASNSSQYIEALASRQF